MATSNGDILDNVQIKKLFHQIVDFTPEGVIKFIQPVPLEALLTEKLEKAGENLDLGEITDMALKYSVNTSHPMFLNQLYNGVHPIGLAASYIVEKMNTNAYDNEPRRYALVFLYIYYKMN